LAGGRGAQEELGRTDQARSIARTVDSENTVNHPRRLLAERCSGGLVCGGNDRRYPGKGRPGHSENARRRRPGAYSKPSSPKAERPFGWQGKSAPASGPRQVARAGDFGDGFPGPRGMSRLGQNPGGRRRTAVIRAMTVLLPTLDMVIALRVAKGDLGANPGGAHDHSRGSRAPE